MLNIIHHYGVVLLAMVQSALARTAVYFGCSDSERWTRRGGGDICKTPCPFAKGERGSTPPPETAVSDTAVWPTREKLPRL